MPAQAGLYVTIAAFRADKAIAFVAGDLDAPITGDHTVIAVNGLDLVIAA